MNIRFKKLSPFAVTPTYAKDGDSALDLTAVSRNITGKYIEYGIGIAIEIPEDHVGFLFPRSSVTNKDLILKNSVGVVDPGYRGEVKVRFLLTEDDSAEIYEASQAVAQLIVIPRPFIKMIEVDELSSSERGTGGFGSTGNYAKQVSESGLHYQHNNY